MNRTFTAEGIASDVAVGLIGGYVGTKIMEPVSRFCTGVPRTAC